VGDETANSVLDLAVGRALAGGGPGRHPDGHRLALAIEGGGMAGVVTAGMCAALESLGLVSSFDVIYGTSAGAMNASYTAARQARERTELYLIAARSGLIRPRRALRGRPPIRLPEIFHSLFREHPHAPEVLGRAPALRVTATRVADGSLDVLGDFTSLAEMRTAVGASASIPVLAGDVVSFRSVDYVDGGLVESIPYRSALREGATHVLVLRSRHAAYRKAGLRGPRLALVAGLLRGAPEVVARMVRERPVRYNREASELASPGRLGGRVTQIAPAAMSPLVGQLETRSDRLLAGMAIGAQAAHEALAPYPTAVGALRLR
jgi:predicted patatin/cPLA2 family phospholipase